MRPRSVLLPTLNHLMGIMMWLYMATLLELLRSKMVPGGLTVSMSWRNWFLLSPITRADQFDWPPAELVNWTMALLNCSQTELVRKCWPRRISYLFGQTVEL